MTTTFTDRLVAEAITEARSIRPVGPHSPAGPARQRWTGEPADLAAGEGDIDLGRLLRFSFKAGPVGLKPAPFHSGVRDRDGVAATRLRPVASAGGLHPVNAHLLVGPGCSVPPGLYAYDPLDHRVCRRGPAPGKASRGIVVVFTVTVQRTVSHYGHRAWPLLLLDAGHAVAALAMAAVAHGHQARPTLNADAATLAAAAGLPTPDQWQAVWAQTTPQHPLAAVHITARAPGDEPGQVDPLTAWAAQPPGTPPEAGPAPSPEGQRAGAVLAALCRTTAPAVWWPAVPPFDGELSALAQAIADRRSAPPPLSGQPDAVSLAAVLSTADRATPYGPPWYAAVGAPTGLVTAEPGKPEELRLVASGEARPTLAMWAAGQGWISHAGAVLLAGGAPDSASAERIRVEHLAAGYAAACAELTATAAGLRTRPIGSWQAADLGAALGGRAGRRWIVHGLALASPLPLSLSRSDRR
ncbi:hypothetical protein ACFWYW_38525 [Nonomuraea sp. NPDC059023]|uniref:hypothetical protein n=1 Tax=unclassified Nonomuraea TaxID=2593643 RepID=UPI0036A252F2